MPCSIRPSHRVPVCCPITYQCGDFEGHGTVWNLSLTGWRFSGNLPLLIGDVCSLTVTLPNEKMLSMLAAAVHWVQRGQEYGLEALVIDMPTQSRVEQLVHQLGQVALRTIE